jgi:hypothetical protein
MGWMNERIDSQTQLANIFRKKEKIKKERNEISKKERKI